MVSQFSLEEPFLEYCHVRRYENLVVFSSFEMMEAECDKAFSVEGTPFFICSLSTCLVLSDGMQDVEWEILSRGVTRPWVLLPADGKNYCS